MLLIIPRLHRFGFFFYTLARDNVYEILFIGDRLITFGTRLGSRLTFLDMSVVNFFGNVEVAILTILRFLVAVSLVFFDIIRVELLLAVLTFFHFVVLLIMLFLKIDVIHFVTSWTFFNIPSTIAIMSSHFALRIFFEAVVAPLHFLSVHILICLNNIVIANT